MIAPKVVAVTPTDDYKLIVKFENNETRSYDVSRLFSKSMFAPLKDKRLFRCVQVEQGGYAVFWNDRIDISEYELWSHGQTD